jgi:hypothetical protein
MCSGFVCFSNESSYSPRLHLTGMLRPEHDFAAHDSAERLARFQRYAHRGRTRAPGLRPALLNPLAPIAADLTQRDERFESPIATRRLEQAAPTRVLAPAARLRAQLCQTPQRRADGSAPRRQPHRSMVGRQTPQRQAWRPDTESPGPWCVRAHGRRRRPPPGSHWSPNEESAKFSGAF